MQVLRRVNPDLAAKVEQIHIPSHFEIIPAKNGQPVLKIGEVSLHSRYDPEREGQSWAAAQGEQISTDPLIIFGLGLAYHLQPFWDYPGPLYVVEPSIELFRLALEQVDLTPLLKRQALRLGRDFRDLPRPAQLLAHQPTLRLQRGAYNYLQRWLSQENNPGLELTKSSGQPGPLKILVISPLYGGSYPLAQYCTKAFAKLGHQVEMVDHAPFFPAYKAIERVTQTPQHDAGLKKGFLRFITETIMVKVSEFQPDLVFALAQAPLDLTLVRFIKQQGIKVAYWFVEDYRVFTYWQELAPEVDTFFVIQEEPFYAELEKLGVAHYAYLPLATDPEIFRPVDLTTDEKKELGSDLSFIGAGYVNRQQVFQCLTDLDFKIWGTNWDLTSSLAPLVQRQSTRIAPEECVKIFNASRINLNLHSSPFHRGINPQGDYLNPRVFDLAASRAFQLVDWRSHLPKFFQSGEEIVTFRNLEELRQQIPYYLAHPEERQAIARRAQERVLREHTFEHRMTEALQMIQEFHPQAWPQRQPEPDTVGQLLDLVPGESHLGAFLKTLPPSEKPSLDNLATRILQGQGNLSETEAMILFLNEFRQGVARGRL